MLQRRSLPHSSGEGGKAPGGGGLADHRPEHGRTARQRTRTRAGASAGQRGAGSWGGVDRLVLGVPRSGGDGWRGDGRQGGGAGLKTARPVRLGVWVWGDPLGSLWHIM